MKKTKFHTIPTNFNINEVEHWFETKDGENYSYLIILVLESILRI